MLDSELADLWGGDTKSSDALLRLRHEELVVSLRAMGHSPQDYNLLRSNLDRTYYTFKGTFTEVEDILPDSLLVKDMGGNLKLCTNTRNTPDSNTENQSFSENLSTRTRTVTLDSLVPYTPNRERGMEGLRRAYPDLPSSVLIKKYKTMQGYCSDIVNELDWRHNPKAPKRAKIKYSETGTVTVVKNNKYDTELGRSKDWLDIRYLMRKIEAWARSQYPQNWEEVYAQGLVKLVQMQASHPRMTDAYYLKGIKRDAIDQWKKMQTLKRSPKEGFGELVELGTYDIYPQDQRDWIDSLTSRQKDGLRDVVQFWDEHGEESPVPEKIKRKIRGAQESGLATTFIPPSKKLLSDHGNNPPVQPVNTRTKRSRLKVNHPLQTGGNDV